MSNELTDEQVDRRERCLALVEQLMLIPCDCDNGYTRLGVVCLECRARQAIGGPMGGVRR